MQKCPLCAQTPSQTSSHLPQPLFTPIQKELFYIEFMFPIWTPPPVNIGGSIGFSASFGVSMGGRACIADRKIEVVLTPEASLSVRASLQRENTRTESCGRLIAMARRAQVTASIFLDLTVIRGGIEMDIQLVKIGIQPVGVVSIKDGVPR